MKITSYLLPTFASASLTALTPALADPGFTREDHVAIFGGNIDPWHGGRAMVSERTFEVRTPEFAIDVDPELSPLPALAEALGVPFEPPRIGYAALSGQVHGRAGFTFGYSFGTGELSFVYPLTARISIDSRADNDVLAAGYPITIATSFTSGLPRALTRPLCGDGDVGSCSVSEPARAMLAAVQGPDFRTTFADARAYADFDYDVGAGLAATVGIAKVGDACFSCFSRRFSFRDADVVPLIDVSPAGVEVAGLGRQNLFPATFPTPYGNIYADLPQPRVRKERMEGAGMSGEEEPTIISFEAAVEKLVPVVGPLLSNNVGPLGYTLLETQGGPSLKLVQSFRFTITPRVTLRFSHPVALSHAPGTAVGQVDLALGESVRIVAPEAAAGPFSITPVYWLDVKVKNSTRLALGVGVSARMLKFSLAGIAAGPFGHERFQLPEIAGVELCCDEYRLSLAKATAAPLSFMLSGQLSGYATEKYGDSNSSRAVDSLPGSGGEPPAPRGSKVIGDGLPGRAGLAATTPTPPSPPAPRVSTSIGGGAVARAGPAAEQSAAPAPPTPPAPPTIALQPSANGPVVSSAVHRLGDVAGDTSPAVVDGNLTVYVVGIPRDGMSIISLSPDKKLSPRDMRPRVFHNKRDMSPLVDVSTTDRDPRPGPERKGGSD